MTSPQTVAQARKLGLRAGRRVALDHAPADWRLADAAGVELVAAGAACDVAITFVHHADEIPGSLGRLAECIRPAGSLWVAWPRRAGGHRSDVTDNIVRGHALPLGLVDTLIAALDDDWSALRLVWRIANR